MSDEISEELLYWYAITSSQGKLKQAEDILKKGNFITYIPTVREDYITPAGVKRQRIRPIISNILFVQSTRSSMRRVKSEYNTLIKFISHRKDGKWVPMIIPDKQMDDFMKLYSHCQERDIIILSTDESKILRANARVKIRGGVFDGVEGYYQRVKGVNKRQFIVKIDGFVACATVLAECEYVELIKN